MLFLHPYCITVELFALNGVSSFAAPKIRDPSSATKDYQLKGATEAFEMG